MPQKNNSVQHVKKLDAAIQFLIPLTYRGYL